MLKSLNYLKDLKSFLNLNAAHILNNRHEYGTKEDTLKLIKKRQKGKHMDCWEALYMQTFHQKKVLINEQQIGDTNPLFEIARTLHST